MRLLFGLPKIIMYLYMLGLVIIIFRVIALMLSRKSMKANDIFILIFYPFLLITKNGRNRLFNILDFKGENNE